jgi:hypothetical protein
MEILFPGSSRARRRFGVEGRGQHPAGHRLVAL